MKQTRQKVEKRLKELQREKHYALYLSYVNDFLTVVNWREYYGLTKEQGDYILGQFVEVA